jgi:hypothetical protein
MTSDTALNRVSEDENMSRLGNVVFSCYLVFRMMDKVHEQSYSERYTLSSDPLNSTYVLNLFRNKSFNMQHENIYQVTE